MSLNNHGYPASMSPYQELLLSHTSTKKPNKYLLLFHILTHYLKHLVNPTGFLSEKAYRYGGYKR